MKQLYTHISLELGLRIFGMVSIWKSLYHTAAREVEGEHLEKMNLKKKSNFIYLGEILLFPSSKIVWEIFLIGFYVVLSTNNTHNFLQLLAVVLYQQIKNEGK